MRILLDGIEFKGVITSDDLVLNITKGNTKTSDVTIADSITFIGDAFRYLSDKFFLNRDGRLEVSEVKVINDCCGQNEYNFLIRSDQSRVCFETCEIITRPIADNVENICEAELNNLNFWELCDLPNQKHPKIRYCDDRGFGQSLGIRILGILIDIVEGLTFGLADIDETGILQCKRSHPAPKIKDVLQCIADYLGLTLEAPIFFSAPYDEAVILFAANERGSEIPVNWIEANSPDLTAIDFLELIKIPFNSDYCIRDGKLIIDRVDRLREQAINIGHVNDFYNDGLSSSPACYTYGANKDYNKGSFAYSEDTIDQEANRLINAGFEIGEFIPGQIIAATTPFLYGGNKNFNDPFDCNKTVNLDIVFPFGGATIVGDKNNDYQNVENRRIDEGFRGYLRLPRGRASLPKLLMVDIVNDTTCEAIVRGELALTGVYEGNQDFWVQNLYDRFWSIEDPRINYNPYILEDFTIVFDCDILQTVLDQGTNIKIDTPLGFAYPEEITINFAEKTITLRRNKIIE